MIKTDALHEHIRLLSETLAEKEINEEKLTTQQQQMKKLMTLLVPSTPSLTSTRKINEKKVHFIRHFVPKEFDVFLFFRHLVVK